MRMPYQGQGAAGVVRIHGYQGRDLERSFRQRNRGQPLSLRKADGGMAVILKRRNHHAECLSGNTQILAAEIDRDGDGVIERIRDVTSAGLIAGGNGERQSRMTRAQPCGDPASEGARATDEKDRSDAHRVPSKRVRRPPIAARRWR